MRFLTALTLIGLTILVGCNDDSDTAAQRSEAETPVSEQAVEQQQRFTGSLTYRARIALAPDSEVVLELRDPEAASPADALRAETRFSLDGRQVPISFDWPVVVEPEYSGTAYQFRAGIREGGRLAWLSEPINLELTAGPTELGELMLMPYRSSAFSSVMQCGGLQISVGYEGTTLVLEAAGETYSLLPVVAASGARYEAQADPDTHFWSKGNQAQLSLNGQAYPTCVAPGDIVEPFSAQGNEPFWQLQLDQGQARLQRLDAEAPVSAAYQRGEPSGGILPLQIGEGDNAMQASIKAQLCHDSMTGMPYPHDVELKLATGEQLQGCGGEPARLLQGIEWVVEDVNGGGIIDRSRITLNFLPEGRVAGMASCNNYFAEYRLSGEGLSISSPGSTMKACAPSLMEQEQRVLTALAAVQRFDISADGALILYGDSEQSLTARVQ